MARVAITVTQAVGPNPSAGVLATETAANVPDGNSFPLTGRELLIARNSGGVGYTVTIDAVADPYGRGGADQIPAEAIAAGAIRVFGPFDIRAWRQTNGSLNFEANNAAVLFSVIRLP